MSAKFNPIVLIHGLWLTPLIWKPFQSFYGNLGYEVLAPAWPGIGDSVSGMRRDPSGLNGIDVDGLVAHYATIVRRLSEPPVLVGHCYGGLITQLLVDQGLGAAAVAIGSIPPKGFLLRSLLTNLALLPTLSNPFELNGTFPLNFARFRRVYGNTLPESEARRAHESQVIPTPRRPFFQATLGSFTPDASTAVRFNNSHRAPLLFIGGGKDRIVPAALSRAMFRKHQASRCHTAYKEFPGRSHFIIAEPGWQDVADFALRWALARAGAQG